MNITVYSKQQLKVHWGFNPPETIEEESYIGSDAGP